MKLDKNRLKEYREGRKITQEQLAETVNVTRQTIISIEGGRHVPSLPLALKFAQVFNCKVEDLFGIGCLEPRNQISSDVPIERSSTSTIN